jgi:ureidoglycolate lyase
MRRTLEPIDDDTFRPYGQLLGPPQGGRRQDFAAHVENLRGASARLNLATIRVEPVSFPCTVTTMECHPHSTQAFLPMDVGEYMVAVCSADAQGRPALQTLRAFRISGSLGVNYDPGIWHVGMATIGSPGTFGMLIFEAGNAADCTFTTIDPTVFELPR